MSTYTLSDAYVSGSNGRYLEFADHAAFAKYRSITTLPKLADIIGDMAKAFNAPTTEILERFRRISHTPVSRLYDRFNDVTIVIPETYAIIGQNFKLAWTRQNEAMHETIGDNRPTAATR